MTASIVPSTTTTTVVVEAPPACTAAPATTTTTSETSKTPQLPNDIRTLLAGPSSVRRLVTDPKMLDGVQISMVYPVVEVNLVRKKDQVSQKRNDLAKQIAESIKGSLGNTFTAPTKESAKYTLLVRILVASDGSRQARLLGSACEFGNAKLVVAYALYDNKSGKVGTADLCRFTKGPMYCGLEELFVVDGSNDNGSRLFAVCGAECAKSILQKIVNSINGKKGPESQKRTKASMSSTGIPSVRGRRRVMAMEKSRVAEASKVAFVSAATA